ncbi:MAG: hypothetical protein KJ072_27390 [Verrucomicrobia bacterium]|nr:hypothetical protein [Verrucomicrobiota bacterium]
MNAKAASRANAPGPRQCLALLSSLAIFLVSANFVTLHAASSGGFASVTIKDQTKDDIIVTTAKVFTADGYRSGRSGSGQMVFEKEASRGTTLARDGIAATQSGARTIIRVYAEVIPLQDGEHRLQCKAFMVTGGSDAFFQDEVPLAKARKGPYQSLLKKVQKQLK